MSRLRSTLFPDTNTRTLRRQRRRLTLIEALILLCMAGVLAEVVYGLVYWRDAVEVLARMSPLEWSAAVLLAVGYCCLDRWLDRQ
jgi:hypothetical protein